MLLLHAIQGQVFNQFEKFYDNYADATSRIKSIKYAEKMLLETSESQEAAYKRFDKIYDYGNTSTRL